MATTADKEAPTAEEKKNIFQKIKEKVDDKEQLLQLQTMNY